MKLILKSMTLVNFKGIKKQSVVFNEDITNITGDNGTGKTTILDAFVWLLFGKDSTDRKDFEVKTLDKNNKVLPKLDHEVEVILMEDNHKVVLKRCFREKWVKPRGAEQAEFKGNETLYYYNDVPLQAKEYSDKIDSIVKESMFKLLTSTTYFNQLHWEKRRACLMQLAGEIDEMEIIGSNKEFLSVISMMEENKVTMDQLKASLSAKKKKLSEELAEIQPRIDEVSKATPEDQDLLEIKARISVINDEIKNIDKGLLDASKLNQDALDFKEKKQNAIFDLKTKINSIRHGIEIDIQKKSNERNASVNKVKNDLRNKRTQMTDIETRVKNNELKITALSDKVVKLREEWNKENEKVIAFNEHEFICPSCKRAFESDDIEKTKTEMTANFNKRKQSTLSALSMDGKSMSGQIKVLSESNVDDANALQLLEKEITNLEKENVDFVNEENNVDAMLLDSLDYRTYSERLKNLESEKDPDMPDNSSLIAEKNKLQKMLDDEKKKLTLVDIIEANKKRILELLQREKFLAQEISSLEKIENSIALYNKAKSEIITKRVNKLFSFVQFKLFNTLINGNEEPCCDTLINGVPYTDANTGSRINAGLEVIRVLNQAYDIYCPVFIDNAEIISKPMPLDSQMIKLTKVEGLDKLKVN